MIASRRAASAAWPSTNAPSLSGPRWTSFALIRASRSGSAGPLAETIPQIPHTALSLVIAPEEASRRLRRDAERGRDERAQVERDRAVGDPLQVVRELLGHRRLVAAADLREAGQPGPHDEALPVGRQLRRQLLEEARPDRPRPDEAHVAAQHVPELRQLVELRCAQAAAEAGCLRASALDQLLAEVGPEPLLGAATQRAELEHVEDAPV